MHFKKALGILVCLFCVSVFIVGGEESLSEKQLHSVTIEGQVIDYTVTTGTMPLRDTKGEQDAYIFYIAYTKDGVKDKSSRWISQENLMIGSLSVSMSRDT